MNFLINDNQLALALDLTNPLIKDEVLESRLDAESLEVKYPNHFGARIEKPFQYPLGFFCRNKKK